MEEIPLDDKLVVIRQVKFNAESVRVMSGATTITVI